MNALQLQANSLWRNNIHRFEDRGVAFFGRALRMATLHQLLALGECCESCTVRHSLLAERRQQDDVFLWDHFRGMPGLAPCL